MRLGIDGKKMPQAQKRGPIASFDHAREFGMDGLFFRTILEMSPELDYGFLREIRAKADSMDMYLETGIGKVNPYAITLLQKLNYPTDQLRSKPWDEFAALNSPEAPELDFVFTVCDNAAGEVCPIWPGQPMSAHWGLPDPAAVEGSEAEKTLAFADAYRMLNNRISIFVNLPITSLDSLSLQKRLDDIGKTQGEPAGTE